MLQILPRSTLSFICSLALHPPSDVLILILAATSCLECLRHGHCSHYASMGVDGSAKNIQRRTFLFSCQVVRFSESLVSRGMAARLIAAQLLRSATAVGANLEEATAAQSRPDFISKCNIALKEAREALYWLRVVKVALSVRSERLRELDNEADQIVAILTTIVKRSRQAVASGERTSV